MLVTEFCERGTLLDVIPNGGMPEGQARPLFHHVVCFRPSFAFFGLVLVLVLVFRFLLSVSIILTLLVSLTQMSAVAYIHTLGIVHEDIKPDNVFITKDGLAKLGDFGKAERRGVVGLNQSDDLALPKLKIIRFLRC